MQGAFDMLRGQLTRGDTVDRAVTGLVIAVEVLAGIALTLVLTVYLLHSGDRLARGLAGLVPPSRRESLRRAAGTTWSVLGIYVRGTAVVGLVDAASMAVGLLLLGVPLVVPLAVLVQQIEGDVVQPRVFSRRLDLHPVIVICAIAAGAAVGGIVAVPIAAVVLALLRERADERDAAPGTG